MTVNVQPVFAFPPLLPLFASINKWRKPTKSQGDFCDPSVHLLHFVLSSSLTSSQQHFRYMSLTGTVSVFLLVSVTDTVSSAWAALVAWPPAALAVGWRLLSTFPHAHEAVCFQLCPARKGWWLPPGWFLACLEALPCHGAGEGTGMRHERLLVEKQELKLNETNRNYKNKLKKKKKPSQITKLSLA